MDTTAGADGSTQQGTASTSTWSGDLGDSGTYSQSRTHLTLSGSADVADNYKYSKSQGEYIGHVSSRYRREGIGFDLFPGAGC